jgi:carboxymethylenebutenolidase
VIENLDAAVPGQAAGHVGRPIQMVTDAGTTGGYLSVPASGTGPGVLVLHAWWGLNDTFRGVCDRLADEGFVALAPELYANGQLATTVEEATALVRTSDPEREARLLAALDHLLTLPERTKDRVGVVGYSMGASYAYSLSAERPDAVCSVVAYYGTGDADFTGSRAVYLGHYAHGDEWEPDADVAALERSIRSAGRPVTFHWYDGVAHWFTEPDRPEYQQEPAAQAWERTIAHLVETLGAVL